MNEDADFRRWLEIMSARAVNLGKSHPIYGKYHGRKVWFWRDGTTMVFQLDDDGCVTTPVNDPANVKPVGMSRTEHLRWYWTEGPGLLRLTKLPPWRQKVILEDILKPSERHAMTKPKLSRAEVVQQQLKALQAELAHLNRFPEDNFANGTVLQVVKTYRRPLPAGTIGQTGMPYYNPDSPTYEENSYTYVLLKANGQWWCTGQNGHQINGASWDKVIEFVDDDELIDVRTGFSVMNDTMRPMPEGYIARDADTIGDEATAKAPTLVDVLGEEKAAKVEEFLANPATGTPGHMIPRPARRKEQES